MFVIEKNNNAQTKKRHHKYFKDHTFIKHMQICISAGYLAI